MTSELSLDRFRSELSSRRQRSLERARPSGRRAADLVDELNGLGEQLILVDQELRVQQKELDGGPNALLPAR